MKSFSIYHLPIAIFCPPTSTKVARWANRHSGTHSPPRVSLSQTQELPPKVMELWVYLAHGSFYFSKLKWKEWGSSEHCLWRKKLLPEALLWDYENRPWVRIRREGRRRGGGGDQSCPFSPVLTGSVQYPRWVTLGWVRVSLPFPRTQGPFFCCQSQPDVPGLAQRILIPRSVPLSAAGAPNLVGWKLLCADRITHTNPVLLWLQLHAFQQWMLASFTVSHRTSV